MPTFLTLIKIVTVLAASVVATFVASDFIDECRTQTKKKSYQPPVVQQAPVDVSFCESDERGMMKIYITNRMKEDLRDIRIWFLDFPVSDLSRKLKPGETVSMSASFVPQGKVAVKCKGFGPKEVAIPKKLVAAIDESKLRFGRNFVDDQLGEIADRLSEPGSSLGDVLSDIHK